MVNTFIRIPKSGSTSLMAAIAQVTPNFDNRHLTVKQILEDGQEHSFYCIIRDPLQQYVSTYYYAKGFVEQNLDFSDTPQPMLEAFLEHMQVIRQTTSLEEYLLNAPNNDFLGKYLSRLDPSELLCIGHVDQMYETRALFNKVIGLPIVPLWLKKGPMRQNGPYTVEKSVKDRFISNNELEYHLYNKSLYLFDQFLKNYL